DTTPAQFSSYPRFMQQRHWDELTKTEYLDELPQYADDRDDASNDCDFYDFDDYSDYAKRQSRKSTADLIKVFERWTKNNILVGMEDELEKIIQHYYFQNGEPLEWSCESTFSKYIYGMPVIKNSLIDLQLIIANWLYTHSDLDSLFVIEYDLIRDILGAHPSANRIRSVPGGGEASWTKATAAIAIGGFQGHELKVTKMSQVTCNGYNRCYEIEIIFTIIDIFGAGTTDRDRGGPWNSQIPIFGDNRIPGLTEMWLLQHCRNQNSIGYKFIPFKHRVNMGHIFKICIP
ncbi:MAG TPA: hypothetical protein PKC58_17350, partial [Ignavibacteria bacterium]|nr:hypothetical protein [Ignavibacteria bacterium]